MSVVLLLEVVQVQWKLIAANQMSRISAQHFIIFFYVERCFLEHFMMNSRFNLFVSCFSALSGLSFRVACKNSFGERCLECLLTGFSPGEGRSRENYWRTLWVKTKVLQKCLLVNEICCSTRSVSGKQCSAARKSAARISKLPLSWLCLLLHLNLLTIWLPDASRSTDH